MGSFYAPQHPCQTLACSCVCVRERETHKQILQRLHKVRLRGFTHTWIPLCVVWRWVKFVVKTLNFSSFLFFVAILIKIFSEHFFVWERLEQGSPTGCYQKPWVACRPVLKIAQLADLCLKLHWGQPCSVIINNNWELVTVISTKLKKKKITKV